MKKDQKNLFTNCHNGNFKKTSIFTVFCFSFFKLVTYSDVITYHIYNINCTNYHVIKAHSYQDLYRGGGGHIVPPSSTGMKKKPVVGRVKININNNHYIALFNLKEEIFAAI